MKIELIKKQKPLDRAVYWVVVNDSYLTSLSKAFQEETEAMVYFKKLELYGKELEKEETKTILKTITL